MPSSLASPALQTPGQLAYPQTLYPHPPPGGFPIQLRHRLHCTLVRSSALPPDAAPKPAAAGGRSPGPPPPPCDAAAAPDSGMPVLPPGLAAFSDGSGCPSGVCLESEERVVLNEVVLDRGISPFLTNLETYCDGNFVTHVQVCVFADAAAVCRSAGMALPAGTK